ncbi:MAG: hypothetical protein ACI9V1_002642 [Spirosomataceae bacterium]|jgi:hypothetical protein
MKYLVTLLIGVFLLTAACKAQSGTQLIDTDKIYAWCIVPYDSVKRLPEERINMLKGLGINKYAYDWREKHLATMAEELTLAKQNDVEIISVWMWIDDNWDSTDGLNRSNQKVFDVVKEVNYKGQIWVSFNANFFDGLSDSEAVKKGAAMIEYLSQRANALGCKVALYNHGDWFGEPKNQLKLIAALPKEDLGLIYNFHHAHKQIDSFPEMATMMLPHLWSVNLNGLRKGGPKILTIGEGDYEKIMIDTLLEKGYVGDFGILGHVGDADVEIILRANLDGLKKL